MTTVEAPPLTADRLAADIREAVSGAFRAASAANPHEPGQLTMSGLGGCTRRAAYAAAEVPMTDVPPADEARAANLGTWQHEGLLPLLAAQLGGEYEVPVVLRAGRLRIKGTLDLRWPNVMLDLKTVGERRLHGVRREGQAYAEHRQQVRGYALAAVQAGYQIDWLAWLYLDRATGDTEVVVERFTNAAALDVLDRVREILSFADLDPDAAPRDERGPGLSFACDRCEWLTRCWGEGAASGVQGAQTVLAQDKPGVVAALAMYDQGSAAASEGKALMEFAKAILATTRNGEYGPYKLTRGRAGEQLDQKAARAKLAALGVEVPMSPKAGRFSVKLIEPAK